MVAYTLEQRWEILRHYFGNVAEYVRKLRRDFGRREASAAPYVCYLVKKSESGILIDKPRREKPKTVRTPKKIAAVAESVREVPFSILVHFRDIIETNFV